MAVGPESPKFPFVDVCLCTLMAAATPHNESWHGACIDHVGVPQPARLFDVPVARVTTKSGKSYLLHIQLKDVVPSNAALGALPSAWADAELLSRLIASGDLQAGTTHAKLCKSVEFETVRENPQNALLRLVAHGIMHHAASCIMHHTTCCVHHGSCGIHHHAVCGILH